MEAGSDQRLCLEPIAKCLRVLQVVGGYPLIFQKSRIVSSKFQVLKTILYFLVLIFSANTFTITSWLLSMERPINFSQFYKSLMFSDMDFYVRSAMTAPSLISCFVVFFALEKESENVEKLCSKIDEINVKHLDGNFYQGKCKLFLASSTT